VVSLRAAGAGDAGFLVEMLVDAVNWLPGREFGRERVLADPASAHYVVGWPAAGDVGTVAEVDGVPVGAAWLRLLPADDPGYGFVAADVPELSMAVVAGRRRQGIGRRLLRATVEQARAAGWTAISLSVERGNPAQDLYRSEGFRTVRADPGADTMVLTLDTVGG
jgi:GNAT superfamily N-acetyltransferase